MAKIVTKETVKEDRRSKGVNQQIAFEVAGQVNHVEKIIANGEMSTIQLERPIGEMLTNEHTQKEFMAKVSLDVEMGRENEPTLYEAVYQNITDPTFPEVFEAPWAMHGVVVFLEHMEGAEAKFGSLKAEEGPIARIKTYSAGFEYTEQLQEYNQQFNLETMNVAFGEAHNALLNHLHLGPIILHTYPSGNVTQPVYMTVNGDISGTSTGSHPVLSLRQTFKQALTDTRTAGREGSVLLANLADKERIMDAMGAMDINATPYKALEGISTVIFYNGWETRVGKKDYSYPGVTPGTAFLIRPKRGFKELVKKPLRIRANGGDLTRLVAAQVVADTWRGVFAAVEENVQRIVLP